MMKGARQGETEADDGGRGAPGQPDFLNELRASRGSGVQVIVGAKLEPGAGRAPLEHSVVVIAGGKFQAVGRRLRPPFPPGPK